MTAPSAQPVRGAAAPGVTSIVYNVLQNKSLNSNLKCIRMCLDESNKLSRKRPFVHNWKYLMSGCFYLFLPINFKHPYSPPSNLGEFTSTHSRPSLKGDYSFVPVQGYPLEPISHLAASGGQQACALKSHCPSPACWDQRVASRTGA